MTDQCTLWLPDSIKTQFCGSSLASTLYTLPVTITLSGELGAGKTTFLKGFAKALGIREDVTSPTYALEQRYRTANDMEFLHLDLYRLSAKDAAELVHSTDDHQGIRCIEWSDRLERTVWQEQEAEIELHFEEEGNGRRLLCTFRDIPLPSQEDIYRWRSEVALPQHIGRHCDAVATFVDHLAELLQKQSCLLRPLALRRAAEIHDLFRFLDFRPGAQPDDFEHSSQQELIWDGARKKYKGLHHEDACRDFLQEQHFDALGKIVEVHGLKRPPLPQGTIEQKLLYYADKRVRIDEVVSLSDRFADFELRYGSSSESAQRDKWYKEVRQIEQELFPDGEPQQTNN